jgi:hypothetical protein
LRVVVFCAVFGSDFLKAMIVSLSLPRRFRRPYACVVPLGCGFLGTGKEAAETPEDGSGAEVAFATSRCCPNRRRFARHDRRPCAWAAKRGLQRLTPVPNRARPRG